MANPTVSVLVDTHNHERFVEKAISSVIEQDFPVSDLEILVVDDGSTDRTPEIVRTFAPKVQLLQKPNGGQASAFNVGIPKCKGEIIAFLDGDDWWESRKLRAVISEFESHPEIGTIGHGIREVDEQGRTLREITPNHLCESHLLSSKEGVEFLPLRAFLGTSRLALRRKVASQALPLPLALRIEADEFLSTVTTAIGGSRILREPLTNYRLHSANLFQFSKFDPLKARTKHDALATIVNELPSRLLAAGIPATVTQILTEADRLDAERIRLSLGEGWPWETVRIEHEMFRRGNQNIPLSYGLFHFATLCVAGLLPPGLFYQLSRLYSTHNLARFRTVNGQSQS
jgi:glycosyltransferase involved in cell wall biosynthesis